MRKWTMSACVVLACGFLLTLVVVAAGITSGAQAQASMRIARSTTQVTMTSTPAVTVAPAAPAKTAAPATKPATKYVVQPGDTLSGIAVALAVRGGWPALYAANRRVIGPDPDVIHPGTVLTLPGLMLAGQPASVRYTVAAGDTLAGIAAALDVPGGWPALYAANRRVIGPDPDVIHPGTVLTIPPSSARASAPASRPSAPTSRSSSPVRHSRPTPTRAPAGRPQRSLPTRTSTQALAGMPGWLRIMLLAVGLFIGAAFLTELGLAIFRRRRRAIAQCARLPLACNGSEAAAGSPSGEEEPRIVVADYDRLVVTHNKADDMVYVLRPPGEDPKKILRVARLVLPEDPYEELADRLGVPASWPME